MLTETVILLVLYNNKIEMKITEQTLFDIDKVDTCIRRTRKGGSGNPIVFHDYESYIAKFQEKEKTTDDTYTPPDVFDAVVAYVRSIYPMDGKEILRPFYPGGDYRRAVYPDDGVVIDNPPFSLFTDICKFYSSAHIPFFVFGPGLTIFSVLRYCSAVIISPQITFENKAKVKCNFATNLIGDKLVTTAVSLGRAIEACKSQGEKVNLPKYRYPDEVLSVSKFQTIARGDEDFYVLRRDAEIISNLDCHPKASGLFGNHLLVCSCAGRAAERAAERAAAVQPIALSERERREVEKLDKRHIE